MVLTILCSIIPVLFSIDIIKVNDYEGFIGLLDNPYVPYTFVSRVMLSNIDYMYFSVPNLLYTLVDGLSIINIIIILIVAYLFSARHEKDVKMYVRFIINIQILYIIGIITTAFIFILGFQGTSVQDVIILFNYAGIALLMTYVGIMVLAVFSIFILVKQ